MGQGIFTTDQEKKLASLLDDAIKLNNVEILRLIRLKSGYPFTYCSRRGKLWIDCGANFQILDELLKNNSTVYKTFYEIDIVGYGDINLVTKYSNEIGWLYEISILRMIFSKETNREYI